MPESTLAIAVPMILIVGAVATIAVGLARRTWAWAAAVTTLGAAFAAALALLRQVLAGGPVRHTLAGWEAPIGIELVADGLSAFMLTTITGIALVVSLYAREAVRRETPGREAPFYGMLLVLLLGLCGMVLTGDLFNLYVFFEISSLAAYALMSVGDPRAAVSTFRYLILGTLGASFYLVGVGFLYLLTGSLNMADIAGRMPDIAGNPVVAASLAMMLAGVGLKMALFPLHSWLPDAYTFASSTTTAVIAPVMTKVSAYVLIRMLFFVYGADVAERLAAPTFLAWLSAAGIIVTSLMAIAQTDVKRMLAYSSIAQLGYIGVGIGLATPLALIGAMLHVLNHATMKCCLFLVSGSVTLQTGRRRVHEWAGLGRAMPWTFAAFTAAALAMVGLPPTNGFFSKWYIVVGSVEAGAGALGFVVVASSVLTAGYMFRLIERVWTAAPEKVEAEEPALLTRLPALALGVVVIVLGLGNVWFVTHVLQPALPVGLGA